jgi:dihydroxyacetone kinase-like predicted kinase
MNISGIYPYSGFYNFNRISEAQPVETIEKPQDVEPKESKEAIEAIAASVASAEARANQTFGAFDYANQYRPDENLMNRSLTSVRSIEVDQAISDMQKDQALHQYQFFVREGAASEGTNIIRGAENFAL